MKRRRSSTRSTDSNQTETKEAHHSKRKKTTTENPRSPTKSQCNTSVRLQNAHMLTKYRNKNSHIVIENPKTKSNYTANGISDDDEIWLCEIPSSLNVNELLGKTVKLGSKRNTVDGTKLEYVSSSFDHQSNGVYANTVSVVFQDDDAKLAVKNLKAAGQISFHKKIIEIDRSETVEPTPTVRHESTIEALTVRHPLFGNRFEDKIQVDERVAQRLAAARMIMDNNEYGQGIRIKQEAEDSTSGSSKKSSKRAKTSHNSVAIKTEKNDTLNGHNDADVDRIKQIFQQC